MKRKLVPYTRTNGIECVYDQEDGAEFFEMYDLMDDANKRLIAQQKEIDKLTKALEFYADERNYYCVHRTQKINSPVADGCGDRARQTLKEVE